MKYVTAIDINNNIIKCKLETYVLSLAKYDNDKKYYYLDIYNSNIKKLKLPDIINTLWCNENFFNRNLVLPESIEYVYCDGKALDNLNKYKHKKINISIYY